MKIVSGENDMAPTIKRRDRKRNTESYNPGARPATPRIDPTRDIPFIAPAPTRAYCRCSGCVCSFSMISLALTCGAWPLYFR